ncbi:MAG: hypothetical protein ACLFVO_29330, partial [Chloroflexaceae bacterium]
GGWHDQHGVAGDEHAGGMWWDARRSGGCGPYRAARGQAQATPRRLTGRGSVVAGPRWLAAGGHLGHGRRTGGRPPRYPGQPGQQIAHRTRLE